MKLEVKWAGDLQFETTTSKGAQLLLDGHSAGSCSPTEALLSALCSCMAIDVLMILQKMRVPPQSLSVRAAGRRRKEQPRYFTGVDLEFLLDGAASKKQVERAIKLSADRYCSVLHSLRNDLDLSWMIQRTASNKA